MSKLRSVVLLMVLCAAAMPQTRILLYDFEARGVDVSVIRANTQVLRDALNGTYKYVVIDPPPGTFCYNVLAAADSATKYGATQALIGNIMAIGGKQFLTYQLVDAASGTVLLADKLDLPPMDEFPMMAERIAGSVVGRKPYLETIEPEKVLATEVGPRIKHPRQPYAGVFMTVGYLYHFKQRSQTNLDPNYFSTRLFNLNLAVSFETQQMLTMLQMGLMRGRNSESDITFDLISNYVMGNSDFAPFFGGGIGVTRYVWAGGDESKNDGLSLSAGLGVLGLRTYYFRLFTAAYFNYTIVSNNWGQVPGLKIMFGVSSPSLGPDATVKMGPGCVGAAIGAFFLTGLIVALTT
jgi:hypothetical protein